MTLLETIHDMVIEHNPKAIAEKLDKPYSTFMREINPNDQGAKFGVTELMLVTRITSDFTALDKIERQLGRVAFKVPTAVPSHQEINREINAAIKKFSDLLQGVTDSMADGQITGKELDRCRKEAYELIQQTMVLVRVLEMSMKKGG